MNRLCNGCGLFLLVFGFHCVWQFQGLDVTDPGYHLYNQVQAVSGRPEAHVVMPVVLLTDVVGGAWLRIAGEPNLLWVRLGGVLLFSLNALLAYKILATHFPGKQVFLAVLASAVFITMRSRVQIEYFTFPALLVNLELLVLNRLLRAPPERATAKLCAFGLGFLAVLIVLARFTLILFALLPVILWAYRVRARCGAVLPKRRWVYVLFGAMVSASLCISLFASLGLLETYATVLRSMIAASAAGDTGHIHPDYTLGSIVAAYLREYGHVVVCGVAAALGLFCVSLVRNRFGDRVGIGVLVGLTLCGSAAVVTVASLDSYAFGLIKVAIGLILLVSCIFLIRDGAENHRLGLLVLASVFVMLIYPLPSNAGVMKARHGMWVALPLMFLLARQLHDRTESRRLKSVLRFNRVAIVLCVCVSLGLHWTNVRRDSSNRLRLSTEFQHASLRHIRSTAKRVAAVDEVLTQIEQLTDKHDEILTANSIPLLYYLTQTTPVLGNSWLSATSVEQVRALVNQAVEEGRHPKLFVYANTKTRDPEWPNGSVGIGADLANLEFLKSTYVDEFGYECVFENAAFAVYSRPQIALTRSRRRLE